MAILPSTPTTIPRRVSEPRRGLIDTSVVITLAQLADADLPEEMAISAITLAELAAGPHATSDPVERAHRQLHVQLAEATFEALPFDARAARAYGPIFSATVQAGRTPRRRVADLLIAATAAANELPLYTRNPRDFSGLEDTVDVCAVAPR